MIKIRPVPLVKGIRSDSTRDPSEFFLTGARRLFFGNYRREFRVSVYGIDGKRGFAGL